MKKSSIYQEENSSHEQRILRFKKETGKMLHLEARIVGAETWTPESISEILRKF